MPPPVTRESRVGPIFDPTAIRPEDPYNLGAFTFFDAHAAGVVFPNVKNADGSLRPIQDWGKELSKDPMTAVQQVAAALWHGDGAAYKYKPYGNLENSRPSINDGLKNGGGECDWFAAVGYQALVASGAFNKSDVMVGQVFANGGWHNVVFFKNPTTQKWDVLDYQNVVSVGANSPEDAMRQYFRSHELGVLYRTDDPNKKASIVMKVRSDHQATLTAALSNPGIDAAMNPSYGATKGLNEGPGGRSGARDNGLGSNSSGLRMRAGDVTVDARATPNGLDRAGISFLTDVGEGKVAGVKGVVVRDTSGEGVNMLVGGEWWSIQKDHYIGIVGGAELRYAIGSQRMKGEGTMTTLAPFAAVNAGVSKDLIGNDESRAQWTVFTNGKIQIAAPFVLNKVAQERVDHNSNGLSAGGILDPGFLGATEIKGNVGTAVRYNITPKLTLSATGVARVELQDWTLTGWPVAISGELDTKLSYKGDKVDVEGGASGGYGVYDKDVMWRVYGGVGADVGKGVTVSGQLSAGMFMSGEGFGNATLGLRKKVGPVDLNFGLGATVVKPIDGNPSVIPSIGIGGTF